MSLPSGIQSVLDDLSFLQDRRERIDYLIALGESYSNASEQEVPRRPEVRVPGCESEVFFDSPSSAAEPFRVRYAVDNPQGISAMAMAQVLQEGLNAADRSEVAEVPDNLAEELFGRELSMGKGLGLSAMVRMAKDAARKQASS